MNTSIYENTADFWHPTGSLETIIGNLAFALRAYMDNESAEISLNHCAESAIEIIRSNRSFRGRVNFSLEFAENYRIRTVPANVMSRLESFISVQTNRQLASGQYKVTVVVTKNQNDLLLTSVKVFTARCLIPPKHFGAVLAPCLFR